MCSYVGHGNILRCLWSNFFQLLAFGRGSRSCDLSSLPICFWWHFPGGRRGRVCQKWLWSERWTSGRRWGPGPFYSSAKNKFNIAVFFFLPVITLNVTVTTSDNETWHEATFVDMLEMEDVEFSLVFQEAAKTQTGWGLEEWRVVQTGSRVEVRCSVNYLSRVSLLKRCLNGIQIYFPYLKIDRFKMSFSVVALNSPNKNLKYSSKRFGSACINIRCTDWIQPLFPLGPKPFCRISRFLKNNQKFYQQFKNGHFCSLKTH